MTGRSTFSLPDFVFEPTTIESFESYVRNRFARFEVTESLIWTLRGLGYANLPWREVNRVIIECAQAAGASTATAWYTTYPRRP